MRPTLLAVLVLLAACSPDRLIVKIENVDTEPLQSVSISAGAYTKALGNIAPGQVVRDTLLPDGESIYLHHGNPRKKVVILEYFMRGHVDSVSAQVTRDSAKNVKQW
jgi:hypothetical protein